MARRVDLFTPARGGNVSASVRKWRAVLQRALPLLVLALGLIASPWLLLSSGGWGRLSRLEDDRRTVELETSRLSKRIEFLRAEAEELRSEPLALERAARDELGLVRRTEVVFQFERRPGTGQGPRD